MSLYCCCKACYSCGISSACRMSWFIQMSSSCQQREQRCRGQRGCSCKRLVGAQVLAMLINYWHKASNQSFRGIKLGVGCWDGKGLRKGYSSCLWTCGRAKSAWKQWPLIESRFAACLCLQKKMNVNSKNVHLPWHPSANKAWALPVFVKLKLVLFFLPDIDLSWPNQNEKQPLPSSGCTAHPAYSGMCLLWLWLSKSTTSILSSLFAC